MGGTGEVPRLEVLVLAAGGVGVAVPAGSGAGTGGVLGKPSSLSCFSLVAPASSVALPPHFPSPSPSPKQKDLRACQAPVRRPPSSRQSSRAFFSLELVASSPQARWRWGPTRLYLLRTTSIITHSLQDSTSQSITQYIAQYIARYSTLQQYKYIAPTTTTTNPPSPHRPVLILARGTLPRLFVPLPRKPIRCTFHYAPGRLIVQPKVPRYPATSPLLDWCSRGGGAKHGQDFQDAVRVPGLPGVVSNTEYRCGPQGDKG